ncbi:MAG: hypothetical protein DRO43_01595 [Candidatus Hecatellales archaeon]|nr:MAG: hypothetical protein DRO43_01595 [Candidatus Hecatellales archaeon]
MGENATGRRNFLKYVATAVVCGVVAGVGGYFSGAAAVPPPKTVTTTVTTAAAAGAPKTVTTTATVTETVAKTVTTTVPGVTKPQGEPWIVGWLGGYGLDFPAGSRRGLELAIEEINEAGGVLGRPLKMVTVDTKQDVEEGVKAYDFLAETAKADIILSGAVDDVSNVFVARVPEYRIPTIETWTTSATAIGKVAEDYDSYKPYFLPTTNDFHFAHAMGLFLKEVFMDKMGYTKCVLLYEDTSFGHNVADWFKEAIAPSAGVEVVDEVVYDIECMDFSPHFARCKASGADFIHLIASVRVLPIATQYVELKVSLPIEGCIVAAQFDEWWEDTGGRGWGFVHMHYPPTSYGKLDEWSKRTLEKYRAKYGNSRPRNIYCAGWQAYYMMHFAARAAERAGGFSRPKPGQPVDESLLDAFIEEMENSVLVSGYLEDRRPCWKFCFQKPGEKDPYIGGEWPHCARYDPTGVDGLCEVYHEWFPDGKNYCIWPERYALKEFVPPSEFMK